MNISVILFLLAVSIVLSYIEISSNELLEYNSSKMIEWLQLNDHYFIREAFLIIGEITGILFLIIAGTIYLSVDRDNGVQCVLAAYSGVALSGILKNIIAHPRPVWKYDNIDAIDCPKDWGSPSGHSMAAGTPLIVMMCLVNRNSSNFKLSIPLIFGILLTALDRVYLGTHFYFQVILGYSFAALIASLIIYLSEKKYLNFDKKSFIIKFHILCVVLSIISWISAKYREPLWNEVWDKNFKSKCPGEINSGSAIKKNMSEGLLGFTVAGFALGRYLIGKHITPQISVFFSFFMEWGLIWASKKIDKFSGANVAALCATRYVFGMVMGGLLPVVVKAFPSLRNSFIKFKKN